MDLGNRFFADELAHGVQEQVRTDVASVLHVRGMAIAPNATPG